jgi:hypothetical protein
VIGEFNCHLEDEVQSTTLQENMVAAIKETELMERPIVKSKHLIYEKRTNNVAIKTPHEVQMLVLLKRLPGTKMNEFHNFPLSAQLGFIHAIPEEAFSIDTATIVDVGPLGYFPKKVFQAMQQYERELKRFNSANDTEFRKLMDDLIAAFLYRPITIQKVIHILIAWHKEVLVEMQRNNNANGIRW